MVRVRIWLVVTFALAYAVIALEAAFQSTLFRAPLVRGLTLLAGGMAPYTVAMWHWWGAKKARERGDAGAPQTPEEQRRNRLVGGLLVGVGVAGVMARLIWTSVRH